MCVSTTARHLHMSHVIANNITVKAELAWHIPGNTDLRVYKHTATSDASACLSLHGTRTLKYVVAHG